MECEDQKTETVALFFNLFNEMLRDYTGHLDYKLNSAWMLDWAGALWQEIIIVFGDAGDGYSTQV